MENKKIPLICVVGPTASGKTKLGIDLAARLDGEIVSSDSMQIYKGISIASAAATKEEMRGIPHHLIEFLELGEEFSVADYVNLAKEKITDIYSRKKQPILVGGTGLYVNSLVDGITFAEESEDKKVLNELKKELEQTFTEQNVLSRQNGTPFYTIIIGITYADREKLYERINLRVEQMLENGLLQEAKTTLHLPSGVGAAQAIGHKELHKYLKGEASLEESVETLKRETRRYAKRQLTWFRRREDINWVYADKEDTLQRALEIIRKGR